MASWTNIPATLPGQSVCSLLVDRILENIQILALHDHSGSAGEGNSVLSPNARASNAGTQGFYGTNFILGHFMPASNSGWSRVIVEGASNNTAPMHSTYLATTDDSASGASAAFRIAVGGSVSGSIAFTVSLLVRTGCESGCVHVSIVEPSASPVSTSQFNTQDWYSGSARQVRHVYSSCHNSNQAFGGQFKAPEGLYTVKLQVIGKNASSTGYGASLAGMMLVVT